MHIPDNYLSPVTCTVMAAAMVPVWVHAVKKVKENVPKEKVPLLGVTAAFSFLVMMLNIPIPGGTTGHAVGGTLAALILGPEGACIAMTIALFLQAVLFGDGGILSFGANCFNMAFVLPYTGYAAALLVKKYSKGKFTGTAIGAYVGICCAALATALELGLQPLLFKDAAGNALYCPYSLGVSVPAMLLPHLTIIGAAEALFTLLVYEYIKKVSPGSLIEGEMQKGSRVLAIVGLLICLAPLGLLASGTAWGEWDLTELMKQGFSPSGMETGFSFHALFADYGVEGVPEVAGYILSAVIGAAILVILFRIIGSSMKKKTDFGKSH